MFVEVTEQNQPTESGISKKGGNGRTRLEKMITAENSEKKIHK